MELTLSLEQLARLTEKQLNLYWDCNCNLSDYMPQTVARIESCFVHSSNKYFFNGVTTRFSHTNTVQYSIYLYYLANTIYKEGINTSVCELLYYLNKIMHGVDWYYEISLPTIFGCEHPVSSVMGKAQYANQFFFYQGCTVGGNNGKYPVIDENVTLYSNVTLLGNSHIGCNVIFATGTTVVDTDIPSNSLVFGQSPNLIIKTKDEAYIQEKTKQFWR